MAHHEVNGGHDDLCWRGGLADGLIALTADWSTRAQHDGAQRSIPASVAD